MSLPLLLLPAAAVERIRGGGRQGECAVSAEADLAVAAVVSVSVEGSDALLPASLPLGHPLRTGSRHIQGYWRRGSVAASQAWRATVARGAAIGVAHLREFLDFGLPAAGANGYFLVTYVPELEATADAADGGSYSGFAASLIGDGSATPVLIDVERGEEGPSSLEPQWPASVLQDVHVAVVGVGSIGSAACHSLARYGVGTLSLVDPDRLRWHNLVRHTLGPEHVGAWKVEAVANQVRRRWPNVYAGAYAFDAVFAADLLSALLRDVDVVLCAADGVAARRVVSHLARRSGVAAVLACVLMDGELGEVIRLRPRRDEGCLLCRRKAARASGALEAEAGIDRDYGWGTRHRPMTAVGSDLQLVADIASKVTVSTVLQARGYGVHRLAGEQAVVQLRQGLGHAPPFRTDGTGDVAWAAAVPPQAGCVTCDGRP